MQILKSWNIEVELVNGEKKSTKKKAGFALAKGICITTSSIRTQALNRKK